MTKTTKEESKGKVLIKPLNDQTKEESKRKVLHKAEEEKKTKNL
ncbi:hypothetical protein [Metabacillus sediminilitoris]|nr:hypothetical protein [Metabacillus sediminilitoris]